MALQHLPRGGAGRHSDAARHVVELAQPGRGEERREERGSYWRYHDGRWSYWHAGDRRWYHTDGSHWYYHDGNGWRPYRFDRQFGREGFERGPYRPPGEGDNIIPPRHDVYRPR